MLRTATRSHSRTLVKRKVTSKPASLSTLRFLDGPAAAGLGSSCCKAKTTSSSHWELGIRYYAVSSSKGVKQLIKDSTNVPPPPSLKPGSSTSSTTHGKKSLEPKLTPRKVSLSSGNSITPQTSTTASSSSRIHETTTSRPILHASKTTSKQASHHQRTTAPFLMQPESPPNPGIIKTAFNDIDDALTNGTLAPLPPALLAAQEAARRRLEAKSEPSLENPSTLGGVELTADTGKIWWHKLKEMTKFYFFGVMKLGREHRVLARQLSRRLKEAEKKGASGKSIQAWRDREFVKTYRMDLLRLVPFISIIAILEEILPLVVIYAPFLLPSTCKLPAQAKRIDDLADVKRWDSLVQLGYVLARRESLGVEPSSSPALLGHEDGVQGGRLDRLPEGSIPLLCKLLNIAPYGPSPYLKFRLRSTLAALSSEDAYFADTTTGLEAPKVSAVDEVSQLSLNELRIVLGRRGFPITPLPLMQLRENLKWWLAQNEHPVERRLEAVLELARWSHRESAMPGRLSST